MIEYLQLVIIQAWKSLKIFFEVLSNFIKEGFHQKFITSDKLQFCLYNQP